MGAAIRLLMTLSGHSVEYAVQQVGKDTWIKAVEALLSEKRPGGAEVH